MSIAQRRDPKAIGAGIVLGAFLLLCIHGLATAHPDQSSLLVVLGATTMVTLVAVITQLSG